MLRAPAWLSPIEHATLDLGSESETYMEGIVYLKKNENAALNLFLLDIQKDAQTVVNAVGRMVCRDQENEQ